METTTIVMLPNCHREDNGLIEHEKNGWNM